MATTLRYVTWQGQRARVLRHYRAGGGAWLLVRTPSGARLSWPATEVRAAALSINWHEFPSGYLRGSRSDGFIDIIQRSDGRWHVIVHGFSGSKTEWGSGYASREEAVDDVELALA